MINFEDDLFVFVTYELFVILQKIINIIHSMMMFGDDLFVFVTYILFVILQKNNKYHSFDDLFVFVTYELSVILQKIINIIHSTIYLCFYLLPIAILKKIINIFH